MLTTNKTYKNDGAFRGGMKAVNMLK